MVIHGMQHTVYSNVHTCRCTILSTDVQMVVCMMFLSMVFLSVHDQHSRQISTTMIPHTADPPLHI